MTCLPIGPIDVVSTVLDIFYFEEGHYLQEVETGHFVRCLWETSEEEASFTSLFQHSSTRHILPSICWKP